MGNYYTKQAPSSEPQKPEADAVKVSVVVPMYCCEDYVEEVLDDLCAQDFKDLEILCVIDGSPDKTLERVKAHAEKDSRIRVFHQEHGGAGTARNHGMAHARGDYLMFLDADDRYTPSFVSKMVRAIEESGADIAACYFRTENSWTGSKKDNHGFSPSLLLMGNVLRPSEIPDLFCSFSNVAHNKIYRKSFILSNQLLFTATDSINDVFFVQASHVCAAKIALVPEPLYTYRVHHNVHSISSNRHLFQPDLLTVYETLHAWLKARHQADRYQDAFCRLWRRSFQRMASFGVNEDFQRRCVRYLMEQEPWCHMSDQKRERMAGLNTKVTALHKKIRSVKQKKHPPGTPAYQSAERQIRQWESAIVNIGEIRRQLALAESGRPASRESLMRSLCWKISDRYGRWGPALLVSGKKALKCIHHT